jgi:hypothetical protein
MDGLASRRIIRAGRLTSIEISISDAIAPDDRQASATGSTRPTLRGIEISFFEEFPLEGGEEGLPAAPRRAAAESRGAWRIQPGTY